MERAPEFTVHRDRRLRKAITERLIYQEILRQEAQRRGLDVDVSSLDLEDLEWYRSRGESPDSARQIILATSTERAILESEGRWFPTEAEVLVEYDKVKAGTHSDQPKVRIAHILVRGGRLDPNVPKPKLTDEEREQLRAEADSKGRCAALDRLPEEGGLGRQHRVARDVQHRLLAPEREHAVDVLELRQGLAVAQAAVGAINGVQSSVESLRQTLENLRVFDYESLIADIRWSGGAGFADLALRGKKRLFIFPGPVEAINIKNMPLSILTRTLAKGGSP